MSNCHLTMEPESSCPRIWHHRRYVHLAFWFDDCHQSNKVDVVQCAMAAQQYIKAPFTANECSRTQHLTASTLNLLSRSQHFVDEGTAKGWLTNIYVYFFLPGRERSARVPKALARPDPSDRGPMQPSRQPQSQRTQRLLWSLADICRKGE